MAEESAVKVCVRVRPLIAREENLTSENTGPVSHYWKADQKSVYQIDDGNSTKNFSFDRVFTADETTNQLYQGIAKPLVVSTVGGYNGTIFAYGQTSSGKTFTMMGSDHNPGVIPLAVDDVFQTIKTYPMKEFLLRVSYMEIYNETVTDLLVDSWKRKPLEIRETINKNIFVADLTEELVTSPAQALAWIRKGEKNRHYGKTKMNQRSSRSHTIFRMILESRERSDPASGENSDGAIIVSHLNLVDLAGSERASQTEAEGVRFKEGCNINRSLFILAQVIKKVADEGQKGFTNYRDSKLTRILQNSLGGNAKTVIVCTITPVTLEETLSTLQFASTAKKMKNDPHVTEVSDDGALLKRYRNEIVDLKRRLQEVSSVTQTTVMEKEVLSQLLQEKEQLQREQEDRLRNLTQLLVTGSNLVPLKKVPKRRVTWGGKMHRVSRPPVYDAGSSDLSFAGFMEKRKAERSCSLDMIEYEEDFDSQWEIPEEPSDEMDMSQNSVTVRSFGDSPKDVTSPNLMQELSSKVSNLELQLESEAQQKAEALGRVEALARRVAELQLESEAQHKQQAVDTVDPRSEELQQKLEAKEKVQMLELKVADLERMLEAQRQTQSEADEMRRDFAETIHLCESLASEKVRVSAECDGLKQQLDFFKEQTDSLEKEKRALAQELQEKVEMNEFNSLEDACRNEEVSELRNETSRLRETLGSYEGKCQELANKLESVSEELKQKTELVEQLQSLSGKDLTQEVMTLRRSLNDAEGLSRDTKKEWAVLRSQKIALEETNVSLTASHDQTEAELRTLRCQLEAEKSRYRRMQSDLQRELNAAFEENTKLTTLLDGKVPKNLLDRVELERSVLSLNVELSAARDAKEGFRAQLEELESLPHKVGELTEKLGAVEAQRDILLSAQSQTEQLRESLQVSQDQVSTLRAGLVAAGLREDQLKQQCVDAAQQLDLLRSDLQRSDSEKTQLLSSIEETGLKLEQSDLQRASLEEKLVDLQQLLKSLEEKFADGELCRTTQEETSEERQDQLTDELQRVRAEKDALLCEQLGGARRSAEEAELLRSTVSALTAERDQLKMDLQENVEMMIENQEELRAALDKNQKQKERIRFLETAQTTERDGLSDRNCSQLEELQNKLRSLTEDLERVRAERDGLLSERTSDCPADREDVDKLLAKVACLSAERDELQELLEALRQQKNQLKAELEDKMDMAAQAGFKQHELQAHGEKELQREMEQLHERLQAVEEQKNQLEAELQRRVQTAAETRDRLHSIQEELQEQKQRNFDLERIGQQSRDQQVAESPDHLQEGLQEQKHSEVAFLSQQEELDLKQQIKSLTEALQTAGAERAALLFEKTTSLQTSPGGAEELEAVRREKVQLQAELEDRREQFQRLQQHLNRSEEEVGQLKADLQENIELMIGNQEELRVAQEKIRTVTEELNQLKAGLEGSIKTASENVCDVLQSQIQSLTEELERVKAERDCLLSEKTDRLQNSPEEVEELLLKVTRLSAERDQLQETIRLQAELEDKVETLQTETVQLQTSLQTLTGEKAQLENTVSSIQDHLRAVQEELREEKETNGYLEELSREKECRFDQQVKELTETLRSTEAERDGLLSEKTTHRQSSSEEIEELLLKVTRLSEDRKELQETLEGLSKEKIQIQAELEDKVETLQTEVVQLQNSVQTVTEQKVELENSLQTVTEQKVELQNSVQTVTEQKVELENCLQTVTEQKVELENSVQTVTEQKVELENSVQTVTEQKVELENELQTVTEQKVELENSLQTVTEQKVELENSLQTVTEQKVELENSLQTVTEQKVELENSLQTVTEQKVELENCLQTVTEQKVELENCLQTVTEQKVELQNELQHNMNMTNGVTEKLKMAEAERDGLFEKVTSLQKSSEEVDELLSKVRCLSEDRDELQETLKALRREKKQLGAELQDTMEQLQRLEERLETSQRTRPQAEDGEMQQLLADSKKTTSLLRHQLGSAAESNSGVEEARTASSKFEESTLQLQETFRRYQVFMDLCSKYNSTSSNKVSGVQASKGRDYWASSPQCSVKLDAAAGEIEPEQIVADIADNLLVWTRGYKSLVEELVSSDVAVFEEQRLQDVLLCRVQASSWSVKDEDFCTLWERRLAAVLDKRRLYLQKMESNLEKLFPVIASVPSMLSAEISEMERFDEQLQAARTKCPADNGEVDAILARELDRQTAMSNHIKTFLQAISEEQSVLCAELTVLKTQADARLQEERSKSCTLLQSLQGAPLKTEITLLKDNQQLLLQLQESEDKMKILCAQNEQLEAAQVKANKRVSNHKEATQLLQTELQDTRAQVREKESAIQCLKSKLRESEKRASPGAAELEDLQNKVFQLELKRTSASAKHQEEMEKMTVVLRNKEDALRKLKETLRKSQQQEEESFLQGKDLHARLTNPKGLMIKNSVLLAKSKLEEEVKQLQQRVAELESGAANQQAEITKWKTRAIKLKGRSKAEGDRPPSPHTPKKRDHPEPADVLSLPKRPLAAANKVLDSPSKLLDSPKVSLNSPKSRFFDGHAVSELLSRNCPKQFFDNSSLGTGPEVSRVPAAADAQTDAAATKTDEFQWFPQSPKQEDLCKTQ